ncbi:hypothetical protein [Metallosphaera hakonensis]|uniref:Uncharacterized protein n=1 Tax=Metallosphaera hakonensis JCM 8857 = DSM 7519 TaxID=1293036 RepID=A0A2U9IW28_9CREN|nr:hypothetical protein [Metallosphaera hakonensis]AWS00174.1 hypothetical protein DFR87_11290 [Metallosphaera hakonensis JCM 8857 = DSM 7519]
MVSEKRWDTFTWFVIVAPLVGFFIMTLILSEYLNNFAPWRSVVPVILGFGVFFLLVGIFLRTKFGRMAL